MRHWILASLISFFPVVSAPAQDRAAEQRADAEIRRTLEKITRVYHEAATWLADPLEPEQALYAGAIRGALANLDPFSVFLDSGQFQAFQQQQQKLQEYLQTLR